MELNTKEMLNLTRQRTVKDAQLIRFDGERLVVVSDEYCLFTKLPKGSELQGTIPAGALEKFLQQIDQDTVEVTTTDKELRIKVSKRGEAGIRLVEPPDVSVKVPKKGWKNLDPAWLDAVVSAETCCSKDESASFRLALINSTEEFVEACNNFQAIRIPVEAGIPVQLHRLSITAIQEAHPFTWTDGGEEWMWFRGSGGTLGVRKFAEGGYPDLTDILSSEGGPVTIPSKSFLPAMKKAEAFSDGNLSLSLREGKAHIKGEDEVGWYKETIRVKYAGSPLSFRCPARILKRIAEETTEWVVGKRKIRIEFGGSVFVTALTVAETDSVPF